MDKTSIALPVAAALLATLTAFAGWEDTGAPPRTETRPPVAQQRRPAAQPQQRSAAPSRRSAPPAPRRPARQETRVPSQINEGILPPDLYCVFLDARAPSETWYRLSYILNGDVDPIDGLEGQGGGSVGFLGLDAHFDLWKWRNILEGDLSIAFDPSLTILTDDGGYSVMPSALLTAPADLSWLWRFVNGWSLELGFAPGIYSDVEDFGTDMFSFPLRGCFYFAFNPELAVRFGLAVRPSWDQVVMPILGLGWQPAEDVILELGIPRSLLYWQTGDLGVFGKVQWRNTTYNMSGDDGEPDDFTIEDWLVGGGVSFDISQTVHVQIELGLSFARKLTAGGNGGDCEMDLDTAPYVGIMLGSDF